MFITDFEHNNNPVRNAVNSAHSNGVLCVVLFILSSYYITSISKRDRFTNVSVKCFVYLTNEEVDVIFLHIKVYLCEQITKTGIAPAFVIINRVIGFSFDQILLV